MRYSELTKTSQVLRTKAWKHTMEKAAHLHQQGHSVEYISQVTGMTKEALLPALANLGTKVVRGAGSLLTAPVRLPVKGAVKAVGFGLRKAPLTTAFTGLAMMDAGRKGIGAYRSALHGTGRVRAQNMMRQMGQRARGIFSGRQVSNMSGF